MPLNCPKSINSDTALKTSKLDVNNIRDFEGRFHLTYVHMIKATYLVDIHINIIRSVVGNVVLNNLTLFRIIGIQHRDQ